MEWALQIGSDCALCFLKNTENCIKFSDLLIRNHSEKFFTVDAKSWYEKSDATDSRIQILFVLLEATERNKLKDARVVRTTRQTRKTCKSASTTN